ncbi:MAG: hypothetical protein E7380_03495 [Clostridiales bacterium]|nr:hypothetical protein [Clostridiales bacterium]MBQ2768878.1 YabP/YqfC family sporulation protein [Clostridia bacterium]
MQETKHFINIEQRKNLTVSGVESVVAFSEVKIILSLLSGGRISVVGTGLKIVGFSKTSGLFEAEGSITGVSYGAKSFASRLFK